MGHSLFAELKRRNVFKAGVAYLALGWVVTQITATVAPALHMPDWIVTVVLWIGAIGFPFVIAFSWVYEITPEGLKRESEVDRSASITHVTGRRMDYLIVGLLVLAIGFSALDSFMVHRNASASTSAASPPPTMTTGTAPSSPAPAPTPAASAPGDASIAVMPFVNMSSDKEQDFFSDGISEELLNLLAKIPALHVAARTSSFSFRGKEVPIPEIAKTLLVANVLEGSVRKSGDQVRITAQLIRAADGYHLWSETYDRKLDDIFKIQDEIAGKVVEQLKVSLLGAAPKVRTTDPQAYSLYLQARQLGSQYKADAFRQSDALFQQALSIDPRYAPAWVGLAQNMLSEASLDMLSNREGFARAREAIEKALAIDPDYASAHAVLGSIAMNADNDFAGAAPHFERALILDPTDVRALGASGTFLINLGRIDDAMVLEQAIMRRDPVNLGALYTMGSIQRFSRHYDAAIASYRTVLRLSPDNGITHFNVGVALLLKGDAAAGLAEMQQESSEDWRQLGLPMAYCALGNKAESDKAFADAIAKLEKQSAYNIAQGYAFCGNADLTFEWLNKAVDYGDPGVTEMVPDQLFDSVRSDPRWLPFLRRIRMAPETLAKIEFKIPAQLAQGNTGSGATQQ